MKKIWILLIIFISSLYLSNDVYAETEVEKEYNYTVDFLSWENVFTFDRMDAFRVQGSITSNYRMAGVLTVYDEGTSEIVLFIFDDNGNVLEYDDELISFRSYVEWSGISKYGYIKKDGEFDLNEYASEYKEYTNIRGRLYWKSYDYRNDDNPGFFNSSIPIFETYDDVYRFISGELTEKDAINYETDLCKVVYDLEIPQDLKITGFSGDEFNLDFAKIEDVNYKFKWSQTDPEHSKWTTQFYCYEDFKYRLEGFFTSIGEWMYKEDYYLFYDDTDTYRCYWNDYFKKLAEGYVEKEESFGDYDYEILCTKVFVRNAWYDPVEGIQHYSNWIKVDIDFTSGEVTTSFIEIGGSEVEKDENTGSLVIPEDNIIVDSDYTGSDYNGLMIQSSTDLVGWIKNGFGLTGENGVIVLMSETFSFIPPDLWYVFLTGISMFVLIAVVKWVRG